MKVLIGCDPEFFLKNSDTNTYVSAHDRVPGTKAEPYKLRNGGHVQADGTAVEFNIPPSGSAREFSSNIKSALNDIRNEFFKDAKNIRFAFDPVAKYEPDYFKTLPPKAIELGCDPDFSAYSLGKPNVKPNVNNTFRTGSGHIHVGFLAKDEFIPNNIEPINVPEHVTDCCALAIAMDYTLMMFRSLWDKDVKRSSMYGKPGCFRPKPYGMEYRTLSNAWLNHPNMWPWLYQASVKAVNLVEEKEFLEILKKNSFYNFTNYMNVLNDHGVTSSPTRKDYQYYVGLNDLLYSGNLSAPVPQMLKSKLVM